MADNNNPEVRKVFNIGPIDVQETLYEKVRLFGRDVYITYVTINPSTLPKNWGSYGVVCAHNYIPVIVIKGLQGSHMTALVPPESVPYISEGPIYDKKDFVFTGDYFSLSGTKLKRYKRKKEE